MATTIEEGVRAYLQEHISATEWHLHIPERGFSPARRFIARSAERAVFVKLGADERILLRLSDAKLTPRLLAGGPFGNTRITVQEFVEGQHPTRQWYEANAHVWARMMQRLSQVAELRAFLPQPGDETYQSLWRRYIGQVQAIYDRSRLQAHEQQVVEALLSSYSSRLPFVQGAGLVPVHGDPGPDNLLISSSGVLLVDWDNLHLSEPMRDAALVAWWMYPPSRWQELLRPFHIDLSDPSHQERFYFYISVWSLEVALFFANLQHRKWKEYFLRDAERAWQRRPPERLLIDEDRIARG
ncbi:MAG: phosphotransferase [Chloroflexota bacterium]|nr:MAG: hypothetical protein DIU80_14250 [Chloroflexota bacterium]